jgi:hypothetical protein
MSDNVNIIVQDTINEIVVNSAVIVETIDINVQVAVDEVTIIANPNEYIINVNRIIGEQVQSDWNETDDQAPDYIKNKPIIPAAVTKTSDLINDGEDGINPFITLEDIPVSGLTSVGLSMPVAFNVANSPLTSDGTIAVSAAGTSSQYIRGDGQLATLPSGGGGGSSVNYYLNGSIAASVATYKQLSNTAIIGGGTDFTLTGNGLITQFLTDVGNPNRIEIPGGAWNFEMWFSMSSNGGTPKFYVELLKYNGTTFTTIANSSAVPETINGGTVIDLYLTSLEVPTTTLLSTDRLAIRVYIVNNSGGRTATLHTEDNHLCEILTTFSGGVTSLNGLTANTQYLTVGTTGTDFNISSLVETHTFNLPTASATNRGALTSTDWTAFNGKFTLPSLTSGSVLFSNGTTIAQKNSNFFWDDTNNRLNIGGITSNTARLGIKAPGALSTDIALRVRNSADSADLMTVNGLGNVGIGIAPSYKLDVNGTARFGNGLILDTDSGSRIFSGNNIQYQSNNATLQHRFTNSIGTSLTGTLLQIDTGGALSPNSVNLIKVQNQTTDVLYLKASGNLLIGTATDIASSKLTVESTTQGFLPPRMTTTQKNAIATPASGLVVYDTTLGKLCVRGAAAWETITSI